MTEARWENQTISVKAFDGSKGELQSVKVEAIIHSEAKYCLENLSSTGPSTVTQFAVDARYDFSPTPAGAAASCSSAFREVPYFELFTQQLGTFDTTINCGALPQDCAPLVSGPDYQSGCTTPLPVQFELCTITDPGLLGEWETCDSDLPDLDIFDTTASTSATVLWTGASGISLYRVCARVELVVTYTYCENLPPECRDGDVVLAVETDSVGGGTPVVINLLDYVRDADGYIDCNSIEIVEQPAHGTVTPQLVDNYQQCAPSSCAEVLVSYTPNDPYYCGIDFFRFTARDDDGAIVPQPNGCPVRVNIQPVNNPPYCVDDLSLPDFCEDIPYEPIDFKPYFGDHDDGDNCNSGYGLDVSTIDPTSNHGTFELLGNGVFRFVPDPDYCGPSIVTVTAKDLGGLMVPEPCFYDPYIRPTNDPPYCVGDTVVAMTVEDTPITLSLCDYVYDLDDTMACGVDLSEVLGLDCDSIEPPTQTFDPPLLADVQPIPPVDLGGGSFRITPPQDYCGVIKLDYRTYDHGPNPACEGGDRLYVDCEVYVEVMYDNDPPVAVKDGSIENPIRGNEDDPDAYYDVAYNDYDVDDLTDDPCGCILDVSSIEVHDWDEFAFAYKPQPQPQADGTVKYRPAADYCGPASFSYSIGDHSRVMRADCDRSNVTTVWMYFHGQNDTPVAEDDCKETELDTPVTIAVYSNDTDVDGILGVNDPPFCGYPLKYSTVKLVPGSWDPMLVETDPVVDAEGNITVTPKTGFIGTIWLKYDIYDVEVDAGDALRTSDRADVCVIVKPPCPPTNLREPASLLLFPEFDNREGVVSIYTVTNTSHSREIDAHFEYVEGTDCLNFNRTETLTPNDTISLLTNYHNPNFDQGYAYIFAECEGEAVVFNHLIGQQLIVDGLDSFSSSVNAIAFRGLAEGADTGSCGLRLTDVNGNGRFDLDQIEYDPAPDRIQIPRFLGQRPGLSSDLILIALTGNDHHETTLDFLIFNDNEESFSSEVSFRCWDRRSLLSISATFGEEFLRTATAQNPAEILGDPTSEAGWFWIDGDIATVSGQESVLDPAFYAVLIESTGQEGYVSDLPFGYCGQTNGQL